MEELYMGMGSGGGMAATVRSESEMKMEAGKRLQKTSDPMEKLRLQCLARGCGGIKGLARMFRIIDDDGSKQLDFPEFAKGLHDYGVQLDKQDVKTIFMSLDSNSSGSIDFEEFLLALRPAMSRSRQNIVNKAFEKLDKTRDGIITVDDMKGCYDCSKHPKFISGEMGQDQIFKAFLASFEVGGQTDGVVSREEFFNYYSGVSASIDSDICNSLPSHARLSPPIAFQTST
jgi:Ca2+-binding EF-hand superfamily protein